VSAIFWGNNIIIQELFSNENRNTEMWTLYGSSGAFLDYEPAAIMLDILNLELV